jgi:hypothetical protein
MLKEAHYTVYFSDFSADNLIAYKINNITVDVIYGDFTPTTCS